MQFLASTLITWLLNRLEKWAIREFKQWRKRLVKSAERNEENKIALENMKIAKTKGERINAARRILNGQ